MNIWIFNFFSKRHLDFIRDNYNKLMPPHWPKAKISWNLIWWTTLKTNKIQIGKQTYFSLYSHFFCLTFKLYLPPWHIYKNNVKLSSVCSYCLNFFNLFEGVNYVIIKLGLSLLEEWRSPKSKWNVNFVSVSGMRGTALNLWTKPQIRI